MRKTIKDLLQGNTKIRPSLAWLLNAMLIENKHEEASVGIETAQVGLSIKNMNINKSNVINVNPRDSSKKLIDFVLFFSSSTNLLFILYDHCVGESIYLIHLVDTILWKRDTLHPQYTWGKLSD